ncbi:MAG: DUF6538 domain-containing protein [Pseudomonadota bacterium]
MRKVAVPSSLFKRGNVYWFRKRVPKRAINASEGRRDYWRSLGTSNAVIAKERLGRAEREFRERVESAQSSSATGRRR